MASQTTTEENYNYIFDGTEAPTTTFQSIPDNHNKNLIKYILIAIISTILALCLFFIVLEDEIKKLLAKHRYQKKIKNLENNFYVIDDTIQKSKQAYRQLEYRNSLRYVTIVPTTKENVKYYEDQTTTMQERLNRSLKRFFRYGRKK